MASEARPFEARAPGGNVLRGESAGSGPVVLQAHGLTAVRSYVTHGSSYVERHGFTAAMYDARGHGESDPAPGGEGYSYPELAADVGGVIEATVGERKAVLAGPSMGAHTATAHALAHPHRVAGLVAIGP